MRFTIELILAAMFIVVLSLVSYFEYKWSQR
jgi:hypothetical protein